MTTILPATASLSRRTLLAAGGALLAAPAVLRAQQLFAAYPFQLGIAAGDPAPDGFVIWTRLAPAPLDDHAGMPMQPVEVAWEVASDEQFANRVAHGTTLALPDLGHSVHVEVTGLSPDRPYWYRFTVGRERSIAGRARTLPAAGTPLDRLRFAVAGCQNYEHGLYTAYRHLAGEDPAFVFHYGDYIYEGRGSPTAIGYDGKPAPFVRAHAGQQLFDLADYRRRYAQYKLDPDLQAAHAAAAWFTTFDDHEVENNWVGLIDQEGDAPEVFALRRAAAFQAYYENMPMRRSAFPASGGMQLYRRALIGDLLDLHLLDTRQFRTDQPCGDGFRTICTGVADPKAQVMGLKQEAWLGAAIKQRAARWQVLAQQVMMMPLDRRTADEPAAIRNMDSWGGYDHPRERILAMLDGVPGAIVLTGDEHQNYAGQLRRDGGTGRSVATEFVSTSISSGGDGADKRHGEERIRARNPYLAWTNDRRGYLLCDVSRDAWRASFRTVPYVTRADAPLQTAGVATVAHGDPTPVFERG
ncbi:alkaline phosphatase D family protein [Sphingomonas sp. XXL09]|uniref:alkaline phosphatase D family protein n=1 Tax=Sphingomonas sp. XXL09 TaxID=3457787 RepID=UPI00406BACB6